MELRINRVRIKRSRPVMPEAESTWSFKLYTILIMM